MAIEVFGTPKGLEPPKFGGKESFKEFDKKEHDFVNQVKAWAKTNGRGRYRGEEVHFPHADGYARYIVFRLTSEPSQLIHLNVGDAWHFPYIERLTAQDIIDQIERQKKIARIFRVKRKKK